MSAADTSARYGATVAGPGGCTPAVRLLPPVYHLLLKREGVEVNWKKLYRLYKEERLTVRKRDDGKRAWAPERR